MRADYLRPRLDLLRARLEPGERILAQGRAFEPNSHCDSFELSQLISGPGCAVIVTGQRVLWVSRDDQRWVRVLPFAVVRSYNRVHPGASLCAGPRPRGSEAMAVGAGASVPLLVVG